MTIKLLIIYSIIYSNNYHSEEGGKIKIQTNQNTDSSDEVVVTPTTAEGWLELSQKFGTRWNFHHALGALDGKHMATVNPFNLASI